MKAPIVISLFDKTGAAVRPWAAAGYDCHIFDLQHGNVAGDLRENVTAHNLDLMHASPDDRIHKAPPGPDRMNFRSATPAGFAQAIFNANHGDT